MSMLRRSLMNLFSRPTTRMYPKREAQTPPRNRGRVLWDISRCIWCRRCEKSCPTGAIRTNPQEKTQSITRTRCIACNTCVEVCPTTTITMMPDYSRPSAGIEVHVFSIDLPKHEYRVHLYENTMSIDPKDLKEEK